MAGKKQNKNKDQIAYEMKMRQEVLRKRTFVADVLFPLIKRLTENTQQAKMFCKVTQNNILTVFNEGMNNPLSTLELEKTLRGETGEGAQAMRELLDACKQVPINEVLELLDGMPQAIDAAIEFKGRSYKMQDLLWDDGKIVAPSDNEIMSQNPKINDFRRLSDGTWMAYSTEVDETGAAIRATGATLMEAFARLQEQIP